MRKIMFVRKKPWRKAREQRPTSSKPARLPEIKINKDVLKHITAKPLSEKILALSNTTNLATGQKLTIQEISLFLGKHPVEVKEIFERAKMVKQ